MPRTLIVQLIFYRGPVLNRASQIKLVDCGVLKIEIPRRTRQMTTAVITGQYSLTVKTLHNESTFMSRIIRVAKFIDENGVFSFFSRLQRQIYFG